MEVKFKIVLGPFSVGSKGKSKNMLNEVKTAIHSDRRIMRRWGNEGISCHVEYEGKSVPGENHEYKKLWEYLKAIEPPDANQILEGKTVEHYVRAAYEFMKSKTRQEKVK